MSNLSINLKLLEKLTNAFGPSGHEREVQQIVKSYGESYAETILYDKTGSIIFKRGISGPKLMLAGHVDEIGYLVSEIEKNGMLKISNLGGVFPGNLLGQEILIRPFNEGEKIIGIVGQSFSRMFDPKTREQVPKLKDLFIDIGCRSDEEVKELGVRVGDPAVPYAQFRTMIRKKNFVSKKDNADKNSNEEREEHAQKESKTTTLAVAKAFDDRIGVFIILEVLRRLHEQNIAHPNQVFLTSTTQEEVGLRGARTAANLIEPDIGFSLDVTIARDIPGSSGHKQEIGKGPVLSVFDGSMIPNPQLRKFIIEIAEKHEIPIQDGFLSFGGTDAGIIHLTKIGCPSLFVGIATRYVHSHHALLDLEDVEYTIQLMLHTIQALDNETVKRFTEI